MAVPKLEILIKDFIEFSVDVDKDARHIIEEEPLPKIAKSLEDTWQSLREALAQKDFVKVGNLLTKCSADLLFWVVADAEEYQTLSSKQSLEAWSNPVVVGKHKSLTSTLAEGLNGRDPVLILEMQHTKDGEEYEARIQFGEETEDGKRSVTEMNFKYEVERPDTHVIYKIDFEKSRIGTITRIEYIEADQPSNLHVRSEETLDLRQLAREIQKTS